MRFVVIVTLLAPLLNHCLKLKEKLNEEILLTYFSLRSVLLKIFGSMVTNLSVCWRGDLRMEMADSLTLVASLGK